ncbi:MAG: RHS repeat-associated core domain-containing protein, partial [Chlamydiales bacterium]
DLQLINFGKRYYDPELARWLSQDPEGFIDSSNLYQYVFNNPFLYKDPDGRFVLFVPLFIWGSTWALPSITAIVTPIIYGAITGAVMVGGYYACDKIIDVYAPDRELPTKKGGDPTPDEDAEGAHTQLGKRNGSKGKYTKAREFDENGKAVRDIEFTDHCRPQKHTCPHQHRRVENETGGSKKRDDPEPVPEWRY